MALINTTWVSLAFLFDEMNAEYHRSKVPSESRSLHRRYRGEPTGFRIYPAHGLDFDFISLLCQINESRGSS